MEPDVVRKIKDSCNHLLNKVTRNRRIRDKIIQLDPSWIPLEGYTTNENFLRHENTYIITKNIIACLYDKLEELSIISQAAYSHERELEKLYEKKFGKPY